MDSVHHPASEEGTPRRDLVDVHGVEISRKAGKGELIIAGETALAQEHGQGGEAGFHLSPTYQNRSIPHAKLEETVLSRFLLPMKLREALLIAQRPSPEAPAYLVQLVTGFEPLHLRTFLSAHTRLRLSVERLVDVRTGLFGDFDGNLERVLMAQESVPVVAVLEWSDLHPWLGWREASFAPGEKETTLVREVENRLSRWARLLETSAGLRRCVLALPVLPLPAWIGSAPEGQRALLALELEALQGQFARNAARNGVRVIEAPSGPAWDTDKHLVNGFPYGLEYTSALAARLAAALLPAVPKKGLITDLDQTLWRGVVGDDGAGGVHWDLDHQARQHGWWQQFLGTLARQGTLLGVASKNDPEPVRAALARPDLLVPADSLFPVEAHWQDKTLSIRRIAATWNVGLDSLVFVDDNPLEVDLVRQALPEVECLVFPASAGAVTVLLERLRRLFGVEAIREEDRLRMANLRKRAEVEEFLDGGGQEVEQRFVQLGSKVSIDLGRPPVPRALELINKTNQFNLNGVRWDEAEWRSWCQRPEARVALLGYTDRYGPLGNVAVVAAEQHDQRLLVRSWVMSCRAFSRRLEYATLECLLDQWPAQVWCFDWRPTERNGPLASALGSLLGDLGPAGKLEIAADTLRAKLPPVYLDHCEILENR